MPLSWRRSSSWPCAITALVVLVALFAPTVATAITKPPSRGGYAEAVRACAPPVPGHASCFALVRKRVATPQAGASGADVRPFVLAGGASSVGPAGGLTPEDLATAYGFSPSAGGTGQTIGIVDAFDDPSIETDLATFSSEYGLPACTTANGCLKKVGQTGGALPSADTEGWSIETALDVETAHATCPKCKVVLVESKDNTLANLATAVNEAVALGATVVSNSYGGAEIGPGTSERKAYDHPGVPIVASTGDDGYFSWDFINLGFFGDEMPSTPASLPTVVAVGGTTLELNANGTRADETVWNWSGPGDELEELGASGGGCSSLFEAKPWQRNVSGFAASGCGSKRLDADVSAVGDPDTGLDIYDTYNCGVECSGLDEGWETIGGTSLSAPFISALYALAGGGHGLSYPSLTLYGKMPDATARFDVVVGANGFCGGESVAVCGDPNAVFGLVDCEGTTACNAVAGFDGPSGVGTPKGLGLFEPQPPTAEASLPAALTAGSPASFSASGSTDAYPGGSISSASWDWGDGTTGAGLTTLHAYSSPGDYTVALTVTDNYGLKSTAATASVEVAPASSGGETGGGEAGGGGGTGGEAGGGGGGEGTGGGTPGGGTSGGGVTASGGGATSAVIGGPSAGQGANETAGFQVGESARAPIAHLAASSLKASASGSVALAIVCAGSGGECVGTLTLRSSIGAARAGQVKRASTLTLGTVSFSVAAGKRATLALHLSRKARSMLARSHVLHALASIVLHGASAAARPAPTHVTIRPAVTKHRSS